MSKKVTSKTPTSSPQKKSDFVLSKKNYQLILLGVLITLIGFLLMYGTENILDFRKITLAPIVTLAGYMVVMVGILKKPKED